jgi:hypothetical protein
MNLAELPFALLRLQYQIVRVPLRLVESQLSNRLTSEAPARLLFERSFGTLDAAVGSLLGDTELKKRGVALVERADALGRAAKLDAEATQERKAADAELASTRDEVVADIGEARNATEQQVADARAAADERKRAAEEVADKRTAAATKRAEEAASQRIAAAEAVRSRSQAKIRHDVQTSAKSAEAKLDDARARRAEAADKRKQADRVEALAGAEKQKRQSARAKTNGDA